ncbi:MULTISPECIES: transglutaminase domain-containing protein [Bacteroides]|uniref:transglutaminase domain-containing protein n=1 Tax=Bacteroides TaxID=816 RepID=UPI001C37D1EF|nr:MULTISPECIES: transglutaminase domain-containing protein [Bacteroides]MBV3636196.1 transglutaminase domain-containing protein [Bacteroides cellulosilyticus]MBV3662442.1 transglutaminase domain-containing protein [Bacteroides cellulosilyticus]MBV3684494.1 transglutaminase domain-containing protein [Bacteroides cellulosilyticus]MBV3693198.1 transglutaminase domain-containing protein [Bacteroides cellulosilyticus]MBV3706685.1 transglutaminase domain-containing protein [Bacteroides cellulosilyt
MKKVLIITVLSIIVWSCSQKTNLELALMQAGNNRIELEKVLNYYANDSLKYKAASFLIENMPYHFYYIGGEVEYEKKYFKILHETALSPPIIADSLNRGKTNLHFSREELKLDIQEISSTYLIQNIDWAFKVWHEQPWGTRISFENFCEYILPYRIGDECPIAWREHIYNKYNPLLDSIRSKPESIYPWIAAEVLLDSLKKRSPRFAYYSYTRHSAGPEIADWLSGSCLELSDALTYIYRALGIPSGCDEMLMRGDNNYPHYWNFVSDNNCDAFFCSFLYPGLLTQTHAYPSSRGKVFRKMFSLNREMVRKTDQMPNKIHPQFRYPLMMDVTDIYSDSEQPVTIPESYLYEKPKRDEIIYLCLSSRMQWVPVDISKFKNKQVCFENVDGNVVFRLAAYREGQLTLLSDPFIVYKGSEIFRYLKGDKEREQVTILHKFNLSIEPFIDRMLGGVFEGSNDIDFRKRDTLFVIQDKPTRLQNVVYIHTSKKYRYFRYFGAQGSFCNVSEIGFYGEAEDTVPLKGRVIGTPGSFMDDKAHYYMSALDGDPYTSFDYKYPDGGWAGVDLGIPISIKKIVFTPRNRVNFIRKGDKYELFYDKKGVWTSAGIKIADSDSLVYNVPKGALLYLRNYSDGVDERIFEYADGIQIFW